MTANSTAGSTPSFRGLDLTVRRRLNGLLHGDHAGLRLGPGSEAEELTRYQPGHDVRRIDWKVTARAREPHLWLTRAEHELDTWLLLDQTPSMAFGTATQEKAELGGHRDRSRRAAHRGARQPARRRHPDPRRPDLVPAARRVGSPPDDRCTRRSRCRGTGIAATSLAEALTALARRHRRPGLRVIVSDLLSPSGEFERPFDWEPPLRRLTARHDVVVVEVFDPRELELPAVGHLVLVDPESGRQRDVDTGDSRMRAAYARRGRRTPDRDRRGRTRRRGRTPALTHRPRLGR